MLCFCLYHLPCSARKVGPRIRRVSPAIATTLNHHGTRCTTMQHHTTPCNTIQQHPTPTSPAYLRRPAANRPQDHRTSHTCPALCPRIQAGIATVTPSPYPIRGFHRRVSGEVPVSELMAPRTCLTGPDSRSPQLSSTALEDLDDLDDLSLIFIRRSSNWFPPD